MITASTSGPICTFDASAHAYTLDGVRVPSITQLLEKGGLIEGAKYFTEESRRRGHEVHRLCMDFELGALDLPRLESPYRGYVLGYVAAVQALRPSWESIEIFDVHPTLRFGGRPDRVGPCMGRATVAEVKSAVQPGRCKTMLTPDGEEVEIQHVCTHHTIQTALQCILVGGRNGLPAPHRMQRLIFYVKANGKYAIEQCEDRRDFDVAYRLIKEWC